MAAYEARRKVRFSRNVLSLDLVKRLKMSNAAVENAEETGADPLEDIAAIRSGEHTRESLLAYCLDGADDDREVGWRDYVDSVVDAAFMTEVP